MLKSVFGQQVCRALTFALARLSCSLSYWRTISCVTRQSICEIG